jgi:D-glycero-D-manno-heptose 1,7-bisphosphate phosphatase
MTTLVIADRDGTLIEDRHYLSDPELVSVIPGVTDGVELLMKSNSEMIIATNQSGVGRGLFDEQSVQKVNDRCLDLIDPKRMFVKQVFYCKHAPNDGCHCRKPLSGMIDEFLERTAEKYRMVYVVGDRMCDLELAFNIKGIPILVLTGKGTITNNSEEIQRYQFKFLIAKNFVEAAIAIRNNQVPYGYRNTI